MSRSAFATYVYVYSKSDAKYCKYLSFSHLPMKTCKASWVPNFENAQVTSLLLGPNRWHHLSVSNYFSPPFWDKAFTFRLYPMNDHLNHVLIPLNIIKYHCVTLFFQRHAHLPTIKNISKSISKNIMKPCNIPWYLRDNLLKTHPTLLWLSRWWTRRRPGRTQGRRVPVGYHPWRITYIVT